MTTALSNLLTRIFGMPATRSATRSKARKGKGRSHAQPQQTPSAKPPIKHSRPQSRHEHKTFVAFHGTPSIVNVRSILRDGWMVGQGNALGDGIYMGLDRATAQPYTSSNGMLIRCRISGITCEWDAHMDALYGQWCARKMVVPNNSAKTAFLLERGVNILKSGKVLIVLQPQYTNPTAYKRKVRNISILSVHRASDGQKVRV